MAKGRTYTREDYEDAIKRLSKEINIDSVKNLNELDRRLKKADVFHDIRGGQQTIYEELQQKWRDSVAPEQILLAERDERRRRKQPRLSANKIRIQRREILRIRGTSWLDRNNRLRIYKTRSGQVRTRIKHKNHWYNSDNVIISQSKKGNWYTRKKTRK